jgi:hypothetical protein
LSRTCASDAVSPCIASDQTTDIGSSSGSPGFHGKMRCVIITITTAAIMPCDDRRPA